MANAMNILEYIEEQMLQHGMSEEDASRCANILFNDDGWTDDGGAYDYDAEKRYWQELAEECGE